jgi:threonyl-tRNA synthetase
MKMHERYFRIFGFADFYMRLSLRNPLDPKGREKYVDAPALWDETEEIVRQAMRESGLPFREAMGEAAFYGPKIDVQFKTVTGREETFCTNQLDFAVPRADRMNLTYTAPDGKPAHPYVIHRAPLGTHERFIAYLIEHFGGAFPTWLAPVQVRVLPVSEKVHAYARRVVERLREEFVRADMDGSSEKIGKKLRESLTQKIPNLLVVGEKEADAGSVTIRRYGEETQATMPLEAFVAEIMGEIKNRSQRRKLGS